MYCKWEEADETQTAIRGINSSKVYCKCRRFERRKEGRNVLIVAKCIVNFSIFFKCVAQLFVLIVAKCIVNPYMCIRLLGSLYVLIVAKCIVNGFPIITIPSPFVVLIVAKCIVNESRLQHCIDNVRY